MVEVAVLEEVAEIFASLRDVDTALARFLELARKMAGNCSAGAIYLRDDAAGMFMRWRERDDTPALHLPVAFVDAFFAGADHRLVSFDELGMDGVEAVRRGRAGGIHAALGLAMRHGGRIVGVLGLGFPSADALPPDKQRALAALARFPAAAIVHARTQELADRRARHADLLRRFGERALGTLDIAGLHRLILDTTMELSGSNQASITEVHDGMARVVAGVGRDEELIGNEGPVAAMSEALDSIEPYVVHDVAGADKAQLLVRMARKQGAGTFMALTMRHESRVFGHLFAGAEAPGSYRPETIEAMRILASMAAAVLEQRSAHADAERQANRLAAMIEHIPMFIEVYDRSGALVRGNGVARVTRIRFGTPKPTAQRCCGDLTITQLDGTPIVPEEMPPALALRGLRAPRREVIALRDGHKLATVLMAATPILAPDGGVEAVVLACQDISALHELAQEKDRFLSVAAHELRTPLTALHATTQLIEVDPAAFDDAERRGHTLARIRRQTGRLVRLVGQLLDAVRAQSGELPLQPVELDLVALCGDVLEMTMPADGPRARIVADGPVVGRWDAVRMEQVVTNLLSNAVRYSPEESEVVLEVRSDGARATLAVHDAGIGIPEAQREMLFTPFFRGSNAQRNYAGGLGLGLHIAQEIVHRHGGSIRVDSREGGGTTFTVELPLAADAAVAS